MVDSLFPAVIQLLQNNVLSKISIWDNSIVNRGVNSNYNWGHLVLFYTEGLFVTNFCPKTAKKRLFQVQYDQLARAAMVRKRLTRNRGFETRFCHLAIGCKLQHLVVSLHHKISRNKFFFPNSNHQRDFGPSLANA